MFYKNSGVDIDKANESINEIRSFIGSNIGAYAGIFPLKDELTNYKNPFLVATSDGIGTKLQLLKKYERWDIAAQDLVAMNLNDLVCMGAKPLFFLDYFSTSHLNNDNFVAFIRHLKNVLDEYECALLGGETAELPGVFSDKSGDIAGFAVGIVEKDNIFDYSKISPGDKLVGLASSGIHSNGYSLVRQLLDNGGIPFEEELLNPTRIYVKQTLNLLNYVKGAAHITGGGIIDNLPRIIPDGCWAEIKVNWEIPSIFERIKQTGISDEEMFKTFNMGIGMIYVVPENKLSEVTKIFESVLMENFFIIGEVKSTNDSNQKVKIIW